MLKDLLKKTIKVGLAFVMWVFILSLQWQGETLFDRAHEVLVQNSLVSFVEEQLVDTWDKVLSTAQQTYQSLGTTTAQEK